MESIEQQLKQANKRTVKIRLAIFFGYNGKNYKGLQYSNQEGVETVEKAVFQAMVDSEFVMYQHRDNVKEVGWSRGARTDKGVHALCNTAGVKFCLDEEQYLKPLTEEQNEYFEKKLKTIQEITDKKRQNKKQAAFNQEKSAMKKSNIDYKKIKNVLNSNLPKDITVYTLKPVTNGFNVRHAAKSRKYEYYMPLKIFQTWEEYQQNKEFDEERQKQTLEKINELFKTYLGTHNFHNFTIKIKPKDPSAMRYMKELEATLIESKESKEQWVRFQIHGASFMYHQIRLMIGMISMIFQKGYDKQFIENAFFQNHVSIWLAPAEGLFLNRIMFCGYNKKGDVPAPLLMDEKEEEEAEKFRVYLQDDVILSSGKVFDEYVQKYNTVSEKELEQELEEEENNNSNDDE